MPPQTLVSTFLRSVTETTTVPLASVSVHLVRLGAVELLLVSPFRHAVLPGMTVAAVLLSSKASVGANRPMLATSFLRTAPTITIARPSSAHAL